MIEHNELHLALFKELQELQELQKRLVTSLDVAPGGSLHVLQKKGKAPQYYSYESRQKRSYISKKNLDLAEKLAQKEYEQKLLIRVNERIKVVINMIKEYDMSLVKVYDEMTEEKKMLIKPYELSDKEFILQWLANNPGSVNTYPISNNFYSNKGIHVRSKSEKIIADMFEKYEVPYVYEPCIHLESGGVVYPDFLLLNVRLRKQYVYEHFGIMSDIQYADRTVEKISLYFKNEYYSGINFLFSMESQNESLDTRCVEKMIKIYLK